jgi:hypothetical protein
VRLPDPLLSYVLAAKPVQDGLQGVLTQLAGFHLLQLTSRGRLRIEPTSVEDARQSLARWREELQRLRVPGAAAHHHFHLEGADAALEEATAAAMWGTEEDAFFRALEQAEIHLRAASRSLPGLERVDFTQACCAAHGVVAAAAGRPVCF